MKPGFALLFVCCSIYLKAAGFSADTIRIHSNILNEERTIVIYKPSGLENKDSVKFLYLLDGEFSLRRYKAVSEDNSASAFIGVGIINTNRNRDMLPVKHPDVFLRFIIDELIPEVEKNYRVTQRILFGHSFAGGFTIFAMTTSPGSFHKYIASSPTPIMNMVDKNIYSELDKKLSGPLKFYFSHGSDDMKQVIVWCRKLIENLEPLKPDQIIWKSEILEGRNHNTSDVPSLLNGLKF